MTKPRIMIVEDEYVIALDIQMALNNLGYEVPVIAGSAEEAIEKAERTPLDLALVDIALNSEMDGIEAAEQLRSRFNIPVVYITALVDEYKLELAKITEPFGYLPKPFTDKDLKAAIEIALFKAEIEMKLKDSEERYRTLIESTEDAVYLIDREMRFLYANRRYLTRHGLSLKDIERLEYAKCHSTQRTKEFSKKVEQVFESDKSVIYEHESEKDRRIFLRTLSPIKDPRTGEINSIIVISKDITERKLMEQALKESEEKYRGLFTEMLNGFAYCKIILDENGRSVDFIYLEVNDAFEILTGLKKEYVTGKRVTEAIPEIVESHPELFDIYGNVALTGKETRFELFFKPLGIWLSIAVYCPRKGYFVTLFENITARKKAEETLREYKRAIESSKDMIASVDRNYVYLFVNEAFLSYSKMNWDQVVGRKVADVLGKEVFEITIKKHLDRCLQGESVQYEMSRQYPEIGERILEVSYHPLIGKDKEIDGVVALISDITERKRAEEALKESENKYRELYNEAPVGYHEIDREGRLTRVNKTEAELLGYALEEMIGRYVWELMAPDQRELSRKAIKTKIEQKKTGEGFERKYICKNGKEIDAYITDRLILDKSGNLIGIRSTLENITERKKAEESVKFLSSITEKIMDSIIVTDTNFTITYMNKASEELFGYKLNELKDKTPDILNAEPTASEIQQEIYQTVSSGETFLGENLNKRKDGSIFYCEYKVMPLKDEQGNINSYIGVQRDVTERKRAEEALRESEERFRQLSAASFEGITIHDQGILLRANDQFFKMFGYEPDELLGKNTINKLIAPESRKLMWNRIRKGSADIYEAIGVRKDGTEFSLELHPRQIEYKGRNVRVVAIRDITERKRAEEALKESEERFRELFENISSGVAVCEAVDGGEDFVLKDVNKAVERIENIKREDILGKKVSEAFPGVKKFGLFEVFRRVWRTGRPEHHPVSLYRDDRIKGWRENYVYKLSSGDLVAVYEDITERKQAEEALRESEDKFRGLAESIKDVFFAMDCNSKYTYWNKASEELTGIPAQQALGKSIYEIFPEIRETELEKMYLEVIEKQEFRSMENLFPVGSRNYVFQINAYPTINGLTVIANDITARKQAEEALLKEKNFVSTVLDTAPAIVVILDTQGRIVRFNLAAEHLTGYKFSEVEGKYYWDLFLPPEEAGKAKDAFYNLKPGKFPYKSEEYWLTKDGERRLISWSNSFLLDDQGWVEYYISTGIDVTERKKVEQKLLKSQKELRSLSKYLQDVREEERKRISREIHDELGQTLTALKIDLAMLAESIPEKQKKLLDQTKTISELIDIILNTVKKISSDLRPSLLDDFGLVPAIEWQASEFTKRTGTKCLLSLPDEEIKIDQEHSTAIFRILQEALTNVSRHARATEVRISMSKTDREIRLTVKDNGIGIEEKDISSSSSLGLIGIRERAQFFKGRVSIRSERNKGTTLKVSIPYPKEGSR